MKQIREGLWQTRVERPAPGLKTHAYFWQREAGNILFYNTGHSDEIASMKELGGVAYQLLSHRDELGESLKTIQTLYGSQLGGHKAELNDYRHYVKPNILFEESGRLFDDLEVIYTPGHSPGSVCFYLTLSDSSRCLFSGDTLYLNDKKGLSPGMLPGSERKALKQSIKRLRKYHPDLVISSAFAGESGWKEVVDWQQELEDALAQLT
ncbi:MBL fold metallo-hydrolase [Kangiella shandongensis]|uniref:MBL fold metallo-hydrolase n=1 Tax=Kangiella shandongensis TaxID=2763258 RepID=UPI001CBEF0EB|nr:MBL fold metallo-hydrolase [Kangiella shandongensis]